MPGRRLKDPLVAQLQVRLPRKVLADLHKLAAGQHRSLNGQIVYALEMHIQQWQVEWDKAMKEARESVELPEHRPPPKPRQD